MSWAVNTQLRRLVAGRATVLISVLVFAQNVDNRAVLAVAIRVVRWRDGPRTWAHQNHASDQIDIAAARVDLEIG